MNEYSMMTQELQDLAALSMEHGQIPSGLYDQYHVLRGLRDVNGKGVLAGLTDISTITSSKEVDGKMVPCDGELRYRGYDIHDLVDGFVAEQRFGYEEVAYLLIFGRLPQKQELQEFQNLLPVHENPASTEGYEGFYHLEKFSGVVESAVADYIIRDHSREKFEQKKAYFKDAAALMNLKYGREVLTVEMTDSYYNMKEKIYPENAHLIDTAVKAMEMAEVTPVISPIRGGTDGARLSFMGLPCPNLCTGGMNYHGRFEYVCIESMEKCVEIILNIISLYAGC